MQSDAFRKACLSATVAVAWAGSSSPAIAVPADGTQTVYLRTNWAGTFTAARFVGGNDLTWVIVDLGAMDAGTQYRTLGVSLGSGSGFSEWYTILGTGLGSGITERFITGFSDASGALGQPFETVFPGFNEAQLNDAILTGNTAVLDPFIGSLSSTNRLSFGTVSPAVGFSNGVEMGTILADFSPVPEPASAVVCLGAMGFGMLWRRRSA